MYRINIKRIAMMAMAAMLTRLPRSSVPAEEVWACATWVDCWVLPPPKSMLASEWTELLFWPSSAEAMLATSEPPSC